MRDDKEVNRKICIFPHQSLAYDESYPMCDVAICSGQQRISLIPVEPNQNHGFPKDPN